MITPTIPNLSPRGKYTQADVCRALGVSRQTVRRYTDCGKLKCRYSQFANRTFYLGADVIRFWERLTY